MNELALFAGAGGGILGGKLLGWRTVCAVEWEPYAACILAARQNDGLLPPFPIWDDVQTFDGKPWKGIVDVVSGGFPCQDISSAGKGAGIDGERSGMWREMARIICEVEPRFVFVENSPMLTSRGIGRVLGDLASMGFDARWGVLGAADVGANHQRDRIWIVAKNVAYSKGIGHRKRRAEQNIFEADGGSDGSLRSITSGTSEQSENLAYSKKLQRNGGNINGQRGSIPKFGNCYGEYGQNNNWWETEPNVGRVADGVAARVDRLKAIGNGQVPLCAATAWKILSGMH